jgi:hypothetical protein
VAEIDGDQARGKIEIAAIAIVVQARTFSADDNGRLATALRDPWRQDAARVEGVNILVDDLGEAQRACNSVETMIRPPATLSAKNTMKTQTPKRFQKSRRARTALV